MKKAKEQGTIPKHELEALARTLYPAVKEFYESAEGKREFEEWKRQSKQKPQ